jgi:hypothetical protein
LSSDIAHIRRSCYLRAMPKDKKNVSKGGAWLIRDIPRDLMKRAKIAAAVESTSVKALILKALTEHLQDLEKKGLLPKGK